jgi:hypothetical protein
MDVGIPLELGSWYLVLRSSGSRHLCGAGGGQGKIKSGAFLLAALGPDASAVSVNDAPNEGQANAGSGKFLIPMQAQEDTEKLPGILHVEAGPIPTWRADRNLGVNAA